MSRGRLPSAARVTMSNWLPYDSFTGRRTREINDFIWSRTLQGMRVTDPTWCTSRYVKVRPRYRLWRSANVSRGLVHITTGQGVWITTWVRDVRSYDRIVLRPGCQANLSSVVGVDNPDAAPGFTMCPQCVTGVPRSVRVSVGVLP